jgi:membrane-bound lytic murein transglycosylase D
MEFSRPVPMGGRRARSLLGVLLMRWVGLVACVFAASSAAIAGGNPPPRAEHAVIRPDGVWEWVERMEGEQPSAAQVAAIEESREEETAEAAVLSAQDGRALRAEPPPVDYYADPQRAVAPEEPAAVARAAEAPSSGLDPSEFDIPVELNPMVEKWIGWFTTDGREYYERWLSRATRYQPMMRRALAEAGLPQDLVYLSMIESGYNPYAYSSSHAAGLWQFIESTGEDYDLRIDWWVDERRDPARSLEAAMAFLGELHRDFGDWRLAWAAYNTGPGRVHRAITNTKSRDFWKIVEADQLYSETENYVPKIMAAAIIGKHPDRYGFVAVEPEPELRYDVVSVDSSVDIEILAACAGVSVEALKALNPALRRAATPPEGWDVRVPDGRKVSFIDALASVPEKDRLSMPVHVVRRDETLAVIAKRYKGTVENIAAANALPSPDRIEVGMRLVIPDAQEKPKRAVLADMIAPRAPKPVADVAPKPEPAKPQAPKPEPAKPPAPKADAEAPQRAEAVQAPVAPEVSPAATAVVPQREQGVVHVVRQGENLTLIAKRYGVSLSELQAENSLQTATIVEGQRLRIPPPGTHVVTRGETLSSISRKVGVSAAQLQAWNGIDDPEHIEVGQRLSIAGPNPNLWVTYTVVRGDYLKKIADQNGVTVEQIREWNGLESSVIQPGQRLKLRRR